MTAEPERSMMTAETETLLRLFIGLLVFRLGGEQTFTPKEIKEIQEVVGGVQIILLDNDIILLRSTNPLRAIEAVQDGRSL